MSEQPTGTEETQDKPMGKLHYLWYDRNYIAGKKWENFLRWLSRKIPEKIVMFSYFNVLSVATTGKYGDTIVPDLTAMDAIQRWGDEMGIK
jgi:hypothetical protein